MRLMHNSVDTVNAAVASIVATENRTQPPVEPVRASEPSCMIFIYVSATLHGLVGSFRYLTVMILSLGQSFWLLSGCIIRLCLITYSAASLCDSILMCCKKKLHFMRHVVTRVALVAYSHVLVVGFRLYGGSAEYMIGGFFINTPYFCWS